MSKEQSRWDAEIIVIKKKPDAMVHGGPGSGRYPAGSSGNGNPSVDKSEPRPPKNLNVTRDGNSIRGGMAPDHVTVWYDGDAKQWYADVRDADDTTLEQRSEDDYDSTYHDYGNTKGEALEYATYYRQWHNIPIVIESAGRPIEEINEYGEKRNIDHKNVLKKMAVVKGEAPSKPFSTEPGAMNRIAAKENTIKDNNFETGLLFNQKGECLHTKIGTATMGYNKPASVPYTPEEHAMITNLAKNEPISFSHNHPDTGGAHSFNDYNFARVHGLAECRVVTADGTRYSLRPLEGQKLPKITKNQYAGVLFGIKQQMKKSGSFKLGDEAFDNKGNKIGRWIHKDTTTRMHEETWKRMASKYGFSFSEVV